MRTMVTLVAAVLFVSQPGVHAQEKRGPAIYKVEFNIRNGGSSESKGGLHYTLLMEPGRKASFKVGNRVPVATGSFQQGTVNTQYTYVDVGMSIECLVNEDNGKIVMHGSIDLSSVVDHDAAARGPNVPNPTVGQTKLDLDTALEPGKPTVIAAIEDPSNLRNFQVQATVTRVD